MTLSIATLLPSWVDLVWAVATLSAGAYFLRDRIAKFFDAKIQHHYNSDLEALKDRLSRSSKEIEGLRTSVLSLASQRQAGVEKRRLEAIDQIWAAVKSLHVQKGKVSIMSIIKFDQAAEKSKQDEKVRKYFEMIGGGKAEDDKFVPHLAHEARPYISPLAWALFDAYQSAISYLYAQLLILKTGVGAEAIKDPKEMVALLAIAVPEWGELLEKQGTAAFFRTIDEVEKRLLTELQRMIAGEDDDAIQIERAARIAEKLALLNRNADEQNIAVAGVAPIEIVATRGAG